MSGTDLTGATPMRVLKAKVVSGTDAASLTVALNNFFSASDNTSRMVVAMFQTAAFEVVVVYT